MKIKRVLDEQDIRNIVANWFNTKSDNVKCSIKAKSEGYGQAEHFVDYIEVEVEEECVCAKKDIIYTAHEPNPSTITTIHN